MKSRSAHVEAVADFLESLGLDVWIDRRRLVLGDDWEAEIKRAVAQSDFFVVMLCKEFNSTGFRQKEVKWARDALDYRPPFSTFIIPFILEPCDVPEWCSAFHAGDHAKSASTFDDLKQAFEKHLGGAFDTKRAASVSAIISNENAQLFPPTTYVTAIDEFGHSGPFKMGQSFHGGSPIFGFGGVMVPIQHCAEIIQKMREMKVAIGLGQARELKGSHIFSSWSGKQKKSLRENLRTAQTLLNLLESRNCRIIYAGYEKFVEHDKSSIGKFELAALRKVYETLNRSLSRLDCTSVLLMDAHFRDQDRLTELLRLQSAAGRVLDAPYVVQSHHSDLIQLADLCCTLIHRVWCYRVAPDQSPVHKSYEIAIGRHLDDLTTEESRIARRKSSTAQ